MPPTTNNALNSSGSSELLSRKDQTGLPGARPDFSEIECGHPSENKTAQATILGQKIRVTLPPSVPLCFNCFVRWLNLHSVKCEKCGQVILPGEKVSEIHDSSGHKLIVHHNVDCAQNSANWCGIWGQGRLVSLHELYPGIFPKGTRTARVLNLLHGNDCLFGFANF